MKRKCSNCREENQKNSKYCHICGARLPILDEQNSIFETETENKSKMERKFSLKAFAGLIITFVVMLFIVQFFFRPSIDKSLLKMTNELNKNCPLTISENLVLKNVVALSGKTIQYNYILIKMNKEEVEIDTLKKYMFPPILESVKSNTQTKILRDNKVTIKYHYSDKKGVFISNYSRFKSIVCRKVTLLNLKLSKIKKHEKSIISYCSYLQHYNLQPDISW